jgi:hypothetical protein
VNEQERKLRHVWATEPDIAKKLIVPGDDIHRALRAFCESEPVEGGDVELLRVTLDSTRRQLDQTTELLKAQGITLAAVEKERAKMGDENIAIKCDRDWLKGQLDLLRAKLAAAEKERDEAMSKLNRTTTRLYAQIDSIEAKHAEAMRALATRNANELNAAQRALSAAKHERDDARLHLSGAQSVMESQREVLDAARRSFKAQLADLQRALESEKKAHGEALRPDEYTRAAVAYADEACRFMAEDVPPYNPAPWELLMKLYTARQRGEPSAPVSSQPPARVLECWLGEYADGEVTVGFGCAKDALRSNGVLRAHRVALPVIETVERGQ